MLLSASNEFPFWFVACLATDVGLGWFDFASLIGLLVRRLIGDIPDVCMYCMLDEWNTLNS